MCTTCICLRITEHVSAPDLEGYGVTQELPGLLMSQKLLVLMYLYACTHSGSGVGVCHIKHFLPYEDVHGYPAAATSLQQSLRSR